MREWLIYLLMALAVCPAVSAQKPVVEQDYDESVRRPVRRLHPERERAKAQKRYEQSLKDGKKTAVTNDPWASDDDHWFEYDPVDANRIAAPAEKPAEPAVAVSGTAAGRSAGESAPQVSSKSEQEQAQLQELLNKDYSLHQYLPEEPKRMVWKDEPPQGSLSELVPHFSIIGDRYIPLGTSMDNSRNAVYLYFDATGGRPRRLRLRVQYYADDPLRFDKMVFTIDGFDYVYRPAATQRGSVDGRMYWENCDEAMLVSDRDLVYALSHAHWVRLKLMGADGMNHVKMLTDAQLQDLARTFNLYLLMGGSL